MESEKLGGIMNKYRRKISGTEKNEIEQGELNADKHLELSGIIMITWKKELEHRI